MQDLGWGDPIEEKIVLVYRRRGEKMEHDFHGPVGVLGADKKSVSWLRRTDLPLCEGRLNLNNLPVVGIGGKRKAQMGRAQRFLEESPSFQGALLLYPGTGNWDLGGGMLFLTSQEVLSGRRVSGGRPEVQLTNYRWLLDGRYVADRARVLHGKVIEKIETELEQVPELERLVDAVVGFELCHPLRKMFDAVRMDLAVLEQRRVQFTGEKVRGMTTLVREHVLVKFRELGVRKVADIPEDFVIDAAEIAPELVSARETLGTIEIPGVGRRLPRSEYSDFGFRDPVLAVGLSAQELLRATAWPFDAVYPFVEGGDIREQLDYRLSNAVKAPETERVAKIREALSETWLRIKDRRRPAEKQITDPREADLPARPEPVQMGVNLLTGEAFVAYPAVVHVVSHGKGRITDRGWFIRWFDNAEEAATADTEGRHEAESLIAARKLEAALTADVEAVALPVAIPEPYKAPVDFDDTAEQEASKGAYRASIRTFVAALRAHPAFGSLPLGLQEWVQEFDDRTLSGYVVDLTEFSKLLSGEWPKAVALHTHRGTGKVLVNWGGAYRTMGATGNVDYWVVGADGGLRNATEVEYYKRYTTEGTKCWRVVGPNELAITWSKAFTAAEHVFEIAKLPEGGCTPAQLATVERLEREIDERFEHTTGMSGTRSPGIGQGWRLTKKQPKPASKPERSAPRLDGKTQTEAAATPAVAAKPTPKSVVDAKPADASSVASALDALKAKFGSGR